MTDAPKRWVDDPSLPQQLREDLRNAAEVPPPGFDVNAGLERFKAGIDEGMAVTEAVSTSGAGGGFALSNGWYWALTAGALTVTGAVIGSWLGGGLPSYEAEAPAPESAPPVAERQADPAHLDGSVQLPSPDVTEAHRAQPVYSARGTKDDHLRREVANLARARTLLTHRPAEALALVELGQHELGPGALAEEREAIAVLALSRLGRWEEARIRSRRFLDRHPESPFAATIRTVMSKSDTTP
jgi:hypothetical protein